jgi:2-phospho-L-lactate guanylyltransferase
MTAPDRGRLPGNAAKSGGIWAAVPVKPLAGAKSRLAPVASPDERRALTLAWLRHVLAVLRDTPQVVRVLVVSADPEVLATATACGATPLPELAEAGLNAAITHAATVAERAGASGLLVLPADLPNLSNPDITALFVAAEGLPGPGIVLAPDHRERGTNALLLSPPTAIPPAFGPDSFAHHRAAAKAAGLSVAVVHRPGLAGDIDTPEDLERGLMSTNAVGRPL